MKKTNFMYVLLSFIMLSVILASCRNKEQLVEKMTIELEVSEETIPYTSFIASIDSIPIIGDNAYYCSAVEDICIGDTSLFVLDAASNLLSVNLSSGQVERKINLKGHANSECVSPKAITCSDGNIYILDMNGQKILTFDYNFNYIEYNPTPVSSLDFAVISNGFLLFNLNCDQDEELILSIDKKGNILDRFIQANGTPELILSERIFTETKDGVVIVPPLEDKMFKYDSKTDSVSYIIKYLSDSKLHKKSKNKGHICIPDAATIAFESERYLITNYLANHIVRTCVYDKKNQIVRCGLIKTETQYPFTPMALKDNVLYGIYDRNILSEDKNRYIILKYELLK